MPEPQRLWLRVQCDEFAVSTPHRFSQQIRFYPADRLVRLGEQILSWGVFAGSNRSCHLRLEQTPSPAPQFCIRYNKRYECRLSGWGADVYHNGEELGMDTVTLREDDTIICDPYLLRVVAPPAELLQHLLEKLTSPGSSSTNAPPGDSDFRLVEGI